MTRSSGNQDVVSIFERKQSHLSGSRLAEHHGMRRNLAPGRAVQINCRFTETVYRAVDRFPLQSLTYLRAQNIREAAHECCRTNRDGMFFQMTAKGIAPFLLTIV